MATNKQQTANTPQNEEKLIRKYVDKVGRIVTVIRHTISKRYEIQLQHYNREGDSILTNSKGMAVSMLTYSFPNRKACMDELKKYPREKRENLQ